MNLNQVVEAIRDLLKQRYGNFLDSDNVAETVAWKNETGYPEIVIPLVQSQHLEVTYDPNEVRRRLALALPVDHRGLEAAVTLAQANQRRLWAEEIKRKAAYRHCEQELIDYLVITGRVSLYCKPREMPGGTLRQYLKAQQDKEQEDVR